MADQTTQPAINLREIINRLVAVEAARPQPPLISPHSGDGVITNFAAPVGHKPVLVFMAGELMRGGSGEDYTQAFDGFQWTVTFAVAPGSVDVTLVCWEVPS